MATTTITTNSAEWKGVKKLAKVKETRTLKKQVTVLEADKDNDADWLKQALLISQIFPLIPYQKIWGRKLPIMQGGPKKTLAGGADICIVKAQITSFTFMLAKNSYYLRRFCKLLT